MSRKPKQKVSFFKVLIRKDFTRRLRLPPLFTRKYRSLLPLNSKLRIRSLRRKWSVKVEHLEKGIFGFTQGWNKFSLDVGLEFGEFLVFKFNVKNSTFDVTVFETSGCEKEITVGTQDSDELLLNHKNKAGKDCSPLYFEIEMKPHHRSRVSLNKRFCMATGLKKKKTVRLVYAGKQESCYGTVVLAHRGGWRVDMAKGWHAFRRRNGIDSGKMYSFEFNPTNNVIQVKELQPR